MGRDEKTYTPNAPNYPQMTTRKIPVVLSRTKDKKKICP